MISHIDVISLHFITMQKNDILRRYYQSTVMLTQFMQTNFTADFNVVDFNSADFNTAD
jgi:hypothetical protein